MTTPSTSQANFTALRASGLTFASNSALQRAARACHPDRSDPAFSFARLVCAGSRSGGIVARLQHHLGRWDKTANLNPDVLDEHSGA
jgi:hypothetical protein